MEVIIEQNSIPVQHDANRYTKYKLYIIDGIGWIGSISVLIPYIMILDKTTDFLLNTIGASGLFIVCFASKQYQSVIINAAWIIGGIYKYIFL